MADEITYRLANRSDIDRINNLYNEVYNKNRTVEQFNWEFNSAPAGETIYVIALKDDKVVGTQCAIPMYVITKNNKEILTAKLEDVLVSPQHRGKNIFGNMYKFSIEECRRQNIKFIWGFAYIIKEYKKIGFEIPFKNTMGVFVIKPIKSAKYFYSISSQKTSISYLKMLGLSYFSYLKTYILRTKKSVPFDIQTKPVELNDGLFNYIHHDSLFGLKLDKPFLDYRIFKNPYSKNYRTVSWYDDSKRLKASIYYNITKQNVGFIVHAYFDKNLTEIECARFVKKVIFETNLKDCSLIRFWGFTHNEQNKQEVSVLKASGFTFLNRGISLVWMKLDQTLNVLPEDFILSRMASQGTD